MSMPDSSDLTRRASLGAMAALLGSALRPAAAADRPLRVVASFSILADLAAAPAEVRDTTLLMAPDCLQDFLEFNDFLGVAEDVLEELDLDGTLQIASFHPQFQFAGTDAGDVTNCTNRAPYPTLHLLREDSIDRAVQAYPEAEAIYERNMEVLEQLGMPGWQALDVGVSTAATTPELQKDPA